MQGSGFLMTYKVTLHTRLQGTLQNAETQTIDVRGMYYERRGISAASGAGISFCEGSDRGNRKSDGNLQSA